MSDQAIAAEFLKYSVRRLKASEKDILSCVDRLSEEQMWRRGGDYENSVANLLLHLAGNMRQWMLHGVGGLPDVRERDLEFSLTPTMTAAEAVAIFRGTIAEVCPVLEGLPHERLTEVIDPQPTGTWRNPSILDAIYKVVGHVEYHAGQIVVLTKQMTRSDLDLSMPRKR
jgi:uncharacterized damage-inducible protein DinB